MNSLWEFAKDVAQTQKALAEANEGVSHELTPQEVDKFCDESLFPTPVKHRPIRERLMERISPEPNSGCWLWTGTASGNKGGVSGYRPYIQNGHKKLLAYRVSWQLFKGPIPSGLFVCHKCDTPLCLNPDHLFLGTNAENIKDGYRKHRMHYQNITHCKNGHELTPENSYATPENQGKRRKCRECGRIWTRKWSVKRVRNRSKQPALVAENQKQKDSDDYARTLEKAQRQNPYFNLIKETPGEF